jgi:hypothetical protein
MARRRRPTPPESPPPPAGNTYSVSVTEPAAADDATDATGTLGASVSEPAAAGDAGGGQGEETAAKSKRKKKRRCPLRPLTDRQAEVMEVVARHEGNIPAAAAELGVSRQYTSDTYRTGCRKLGMQPKRRSAHKEQPFPRDRRGQDRVAEGDDRRRG